jgi:hypothetical protein
LRPSRLELTLAAAVLVYSVVVTGWVSIRLSEYAVPVIVYGVAITAMTVSAILARFSTPLDRCDAVRDLGFPDRRWAFQDGTAADRLSGLAGVLSGSVRYRHRLSAG